jgi:hypothetical protein
MLFAEEGAKVVVNYHERMDDAKAVVEAIAPAKALAATFDGARITCTDRRWLMPMEYVLRAPPRAARPSRALPTDSRRNSTARVGVLTRTGRCMPGSFAGRVRAAL